MRLPPTAIVSILHRISGVLLFLTLPILAWMVGDLLAGRTLERWSAPSLQPLWWLIIWAWIHHALAGLRLLFADFHWGLDAAVARKTAWVVIIASPVVAFGLWWGLL